MYDTKPVEAFEFHRSMLTDRVRTDAFFSALMQTIKPDDVVLDIGSGTGVLACFACLAGAKHVYAVEQGPIIGLAREIAANNGLQDRITFINDWSTNSKLPEAVDILVSETLGNTGFEEGILAWILDAQKRLLKQNARIIPRRLEMIVVPVESKDAYEMVDEWTYDYYTLDFSALHTLAANNLLWMDLKPGMFLSDPASLVKVDLYQISTPELSAEVSFTAIKKGTIHGFSGWFIAELAEGISISNEPPSRTPSWSNTFLPLEHPLEVEAGDRIDLKLHTRHKTARWHWQTAHFPAEAERVDAVLPEQTTRSGELSAFIASGDLDCLPSRNSSGDIDLFILDRMNGDLTVAEISQQTKDRFPERFSSHDSLLESIYRLMSLYAGSD